MKTILLEDQLIEIYRRVDKLRYRDEYLYFIKKNNKWKLWYKYFINKETFYNGFNFNPLNSIRNFMIEKFNQKNNL